MGTENDLDVEGQTEPSIRGLTSSASVSSLNPASASPTLAGTVATDDDPIPAAASALVPDSAHTLTVPGVCALLNTDLE